MTVPRIVVTGKIPEPGVEVLKTIGEVWAWTDDEPIPHDIRDEQLATADAVVTLLTDTVDEAFLDAAPQLKIVANVAVGYNNIDVGLCQVRGVTVTNTPGVLTDATADLAMTLMLMLCRRAGEGERELRAGAWAGWRPTHLVGQAMTGKTLGIIGMGRIGKAVAQRAHFGFGMEIGCFNRSPVADGAGVGATQYDSVAALCAASDFVSLHCAATPDTFEILNEEALAAMSADAYVINTARGDVVDETALVAALESGAIAGAGLDVFQGEPAVNPAILAAPNTVLLPHLGSATRETRVAMGLKVVANARAFAAGEPLPDPVG